MQCYVCNEAKTEREAVATCPRCSVGLCATHANATTVRRGSGTSWGACGHTSHGANR